ncbi:hypothetical protein [Bacterioplanoides sp.]|uniref:hypothetical protein n=1 Tax=Bacterioplanoides sp. TaxID=2066072 RepID=UPI003B5C6C60
MNLTLEQGQTGTVETEELQDQIRSLISELNWKIPKLAEVLYVALNDDETKDEKSEIEAFYEKLKGHLKRKSTRPELLNNYLNIITNHPEYIKSSVISARYVPSNSISATLRSGLKSISKNITQNIDENDL